MSLRGSAVLCSSATAKGDNEQYNVQQCKQNIHKDDNIMGYG